MSTPRTSKKRAEVSVVMPVFNGANFLHRSISSVRAQTLQDWELLVVDDCSSDGSYEILCQYSALDFRIRPFRMTENRGPAAARNHALLHANGKMIAYLDCDDEYYPDYLRYVSRCQHKAEVLVFAYDAVDETGLILPPGEIWTWDPAVARMDLLRENVACPLGVAHRRELIEKVGVYDEATYISEDWELWKRFAQAGAEFIFLPIMSGLYHIRGESQSRTGRIPDAGIAPPFRDGPDSNIVREDAGQ